MKLSSRDTNSTEIKLMLKVDEANGNFPSCLINKPSEEEEDLFIILWLRCILSWELSK